MPIFKINDIEQAAHALLPEPRHIAKDCAWLEACGYPGLSLLLEAVADQKRDIRLMPDSLGLNTHNISCVFIGQKIMDLVAQHGRLLLRNVRHGLYLLPFTVRSGIGIGCPVDLNFSIGGEREKNPYEEKFTVAEADGVTINEAVWEAVQLRVSA